MNSSISSLRRPLAMLALIAAAALPVHAENAVPVEDFSVFVDMPTGFAFVKTPSGWRFVRQLPPSQLSQLHPSTLVSVIQAGERFGQTDAKAPAAGTSRSQL